MPISSRVLALAGTHAIWPSSLAALAVAIFLACLIALFRARGHHAESEKLLERQQELTLDLVSTASFSGYFVQLNPAWKHVLGFELDALKRRPFLEFVHPDDVEASRAAVESQAGSGEHLFNFQNRYRCADGSYRWLEWTSRPDVEAGLMYGVARDVTERKKAEEILARHQALLEEMVAQRTAELEEARWETLRCLALAAEYRDDQTYDHTQRVGRTAALLAERLGMDPEWCDLLRHAAPLHDIGKVGIPDAILLKPGRLTPEELEILRGHAAAGARILSGSSSALLHLAQEIAATHHEWWDGTGYPECLAADAIPLSGRITAVADVFDALTHERPYKAAWSVPEAAAEMRRLSGMQFDPRIIDVFDDLDHFEIAGQIPGEEPATYLRAVS
jgi:putative two-component system response regulator